MKVAGKSNLCIHWTSTGAFIGERMASADCFECQSFKRPIHDLLQQTLLFGAVLDVHTNAHRIECDSGAAIVPCEFEFSCGQRKRANSPKWQKLTSWYFWHLTDFNWIPFVGWKYDILFKFSVYRRKWLSIRAKITLQYLVSDVRWHTQKLFRQPSNRRYQKKCHQTIGRKLI